MTRRLHYDGPATTWLEALPIGNGLLGAMCHGGAQQERFGLNHTAGWSGSPAAERAGDVPDAAACRDAIATSRDAVARRDWAAADAALGAVQHGLPQTFLPVADLLLDLPSADGSPVEGARRELDLATGVHRSTTRRGDRTVTTTARASHPHDVLLVVVEADGDGVDLALEVTSPLKVLRCEEREDGLDLLVRFPSAVAAPGDGEPVRYDDGQPALEGAVAVRWRHDGATGSGVRARGVRRAEVVLAIGTTAADAGRRLAGSADDALSTAVGRCAQALADGPDAVARAQEADHRALADRCVLELPGTADGAEVLPTDVRLRRAFARGGGALAADPGLAALLFDYGRYLLISSSREGGAPANLQGIWNDLLQPPWSSDYTSNINLEMNYWLAETTDLPECTEPLLDWLETLAASGEETADRVFGAPGWAAFHCSDLWGYSQSVGDGGHDPSWAFWPFAGAWLVQHLRDRLRFGGGDDVARRAWPLVRGAAAFVDAFLVEETTGALGTSPSTSPENHFTSPEGRGATARSSTMDTALARALLRFLLELADRLGIDGDPLVDRAARALDRLPRPLVGPDGLVAEWPDPSLAPDPDHRHTAHLWFVHPGEEPYGAELAAAADASLTARGDESTGWSLVWKTAMRARLRQPDRAGDLLRLLFRDAQASTAAFAGGLYPNLFAAHPPFQIDANLGFPAAVAECLVQSHAGVVDLLPALPAVLGPGRVRGLVARPGIRVDLEWNRDGLVAALLTARPSGAGLHRVRLGDRVLEVDLESGVPLPLPAGRFAAGALFEDEES